MSLRLYKELAGLGACGKQHLENGGAMKHKLLKDVSKMLFVPNGISTERSTRSNCNKDHAIKSKATVKGALSLIALNNDIFKSKGKH